MNWEVRAGGVLVVLLAYTLGGHPVAADAAVPAPAARVMPFTQAYAPELFGLAQLRLVRSGAQVTGTVVNGWVSFSLKGTLSSGVISGSLLQTAGPVIMDRRCPTCAEYPAGRIHFNMMVDGDHFRGWIFFRGHTRKYCGGLGFIPEQCMLK